MKKALYILLLALLVAIAIRLYPTLASGMPFSTDAWPLIRNTELLLQNTPTPITSAVFDGYNNYWPGSQLFGAVLSQVLALPSTTAMALGIPVAAALTIPIFYLLVKKITKNTQVSLIAAMLLATAFPYALFTAGVTKETFAAPLLISLILLFLLKHDRKNLLLFSTVAAALALSHHLTAFMAVGIVASLAVASILIKKSPAEKANSQSNLLFAAILSCIVGLYFGLFAFPALKLTLTVSDLLSVGAYQFLLTSLLIYLTFVAKNFSAIRTTLNCILGFTLIFTLMLLITQIPLLPSAPTLPFHYFLYALPFIVGLPLIIFGLNELYQKSSYLILPLFWVLPVAAFACYAVFSNAAGGVGFAYRSVNFMIPPFIVLVAIGLYKLLSGGKPRRTRLVSVFFAVVTIFCMVSVGVYSVYATFSLQEPYLGYFWRYQPSEYQASQWLAASGNNQTVTGDFKVHYLLNGYFNQNVTVPEGLWYFEGNGSVPQMLYVYGQMHLNGYVLYEGSPRDLPANWTDKLSGFNQVYGNCEVTIYAKR